MGCASSQKQLLQNVRLPTVNGIIKVTIVNAIIQHLTSTFFAMDPYIKIKISNQVAITKIIQKGGKQPVFNQTHSFFINSCYQKHGRTLQIQLWDHNKTSDTLIGFGIADLQPVLKSKQIKTDLRVILNHQLKSAGIVNTVIQFKQQPIQLLNFRFQTASIRRKTSTLSNMNCFVQVTIGQQVLKTKKQKDTKELPPVWTDQILTFNVPKVIKNCLIEIYDDKQIVGQLVINVQDLLKQSKQQSFDQQFDFENVIAGTIKFQTLIGNNPLFSEIKRDYRRKPEQKNQKTEEQKKQNNPEEKNNQKNDKKQENKQEKKQEIKKQVN